LGEGTCAAAANDLQYLASEDDRRRRTIVDDNACWRAEVLLDLAERLGDRLMLGDIERHRVEALLLRALDVRLARSNGDLVAFLGKEACNTQANTRTSSDDERNGRRHVERKFGGRRIGEDEGDDGRCLGSLPFYAEWATMSFLASYCATKSA
jgi:hypothetical protein